MNALKGEKDSLKREKLEAQVYSNLGIIYYEQKIFAKSLEIFHEAESILLKYNMRAQLAVLYNNLGDTYTETQEFNKAYEYLQQSQELNKEFNDKVGVAICMNSFGNLYYSLDHFDDAIEAHLKAIKSFQILGATSSLPESYLGLGRTFLEAGNTKDAHMALLKGLQIALKSGQKLQELELYVELVALHRSNDQLEMALMYYDLYSVLSQELNDQQIGRFIGQQELKEHLDKRDLALASLQSETALLEFQITQRNTLLILSILVIILISSLFTMVYWQHRLRSMNKNFALEQKLLRTQLNPHFIFNALGAIQHYMYNKTPHDAARYLSKFSKLMRSILESSRTSKTTLSTELETMKFYLDLQSLRFNKPFQYTIELDPELDPDLIQIPSLLIQPLLENAIEHGLRPKQGGHINIEIKQETDHIVIAVEDDGVGLEYSKKNKQYENGKQSLGNTITVERLSLINRKSKKKILFKVESRSQIEEGLSGTRASLIIPIN
jgi:signal transduction histidine kinase